METKVVNIEALQRAAEVRLPEQFVDLQAFSAWSLATETARNTRRHATSMEEITEFANAMLPRLDAIFIYLGSQPLESLAPEAKALMCMTLSMAEVAPAIEFYRQQAVIDGFDPRRFVADESFVMSPAI